MGTTTDIPLVRVAHAGLRLAIAAALFPYLLIVPLAGIGIAMDGGWCGVTAFATGMALIVASIWSAVILLLAAVVLIVRIRREAGAWTGVRRTLLAICLIGSVTPTLLAYAGMTIPAGPCADGRRIPVASSGIPAVMPALSPRSG